ncbi:MAG: hypothetical protein AAF206_14740 [Bacteroidota bacterium]
MNKQAYIYGGLGLLAILVIIMIGRLIKAITKASVENEIREELSEVAEENGYDMEAVILDAKAIKTALGIGTGWFGSNGWTEDEEAVIAVIDDYDRKGFVLLEEAYEGLAPGRRLTNDLRMFLSESEFDGIAHIVL